MVYLFSGFGLFFYLGWSNIYITALSGDAWAESGYILLLITPQYLFRKANDTFTGILQGINAPHDVLIGTALRIPILVFGGFILFKYWGILGHGNDLESNGISLCNLYVFKN